MKHYYLAALGLSGVQQLGVDERKTKPVGEPIDQDEVSVV